MKKLDRIRNRQSYKEFSKLLKFYNKNPKPSTFLKKIFSTLDNHKGFGTATNAYYAQESVKQLIKDRRLK